MIQLLKNLFGLGPKTNYNELMKNGAQIIDVRSKSEYQQGHIKGSVNIPLQEIVDREEELLAMSKPIIFCCASGGRSGQAAGYYKQKGSLQPNLLHTGRVCFVHHYPVQ